MDLLAVNRESLSAIETEVANITSNGVHLPRADDLEGELGVFRGSITKPYIEALLAALEVRFPQLPYLSALSIFQPDIMPIEDTEKLAHHGREELATLLDIVNNEDFQFVNATEAYRELRHMKSAVKVTPALRSARSASDFIAQLCKPEHADLKARLPELMKLADWGLALPVASVECERDFSKMKLIKTPLRNRLDNVNLSRLIRLSVDGPSLRQFPFDEALVLWHQ